MSNESIEPVKSEEPVFNYDEKLVWQGNPSQNANMKIFVGCLLLSWLVFPVLYALWKWYELETTNYIITNERILIKSGIFSRVTQELELYRVKDYTVEEPFELRIFHLANIVLVSSDKSLPSITLYAISEAETLRDHIRYHVERLRAAKGVREVDLK